MIDGERDDGETDDRELNPDDGMAELSLDDLGAAYARAAAEHDPEAFAPLSDETADESSPENAPENDADDSAILADENDPVVSPETIIEGALFVGHPDGKPISEHRLASLMRGVTPEEVVASIEHLNQSYRDNDQALRIVGDDQGYRMSLCPDVESVRRSFMGKVREAKLTQSAIEVLALVAYQPGITLQKVQDQRGRESGSLLNQLVRRQLLRIERKAPDGGGRAMPHYHPTERFLYLFGLDSIDELPQVEEGLREG